MGTIPRDVAPIVINRSVLDHILDYSDRNPDIEVGGFLLGEFCEDPGNGQAFIEISEYVKATQVNSSYRTLTFTHDSWAQLHQQLTNRFPGHQVVGWHHTHPGFGIFLSQQDEFIHRHFFDQPWQVALVVDPRRGELGFFQWREDAIVDAGFLVQRHHKSGRKQKKTARSSSGKQTAR